MDVKTKTFFIIISTLVIGIVVGGLAHRIILQKRIQRAFSVRNPEYLVSMYEKTLNPNSEQAKQLREILNKHAKTMAEIRNDFQEDMFSTSEALDKELNKILTPAQKRRLHRRPFRPRRSAEKKKRGPFTRARMPFLMEDIQFFKDRLSLSDEQVQKIQDLLKKPRLRRELRPRQEPNLQRIFQWWKERERAIDEAVLEILTEEQKKAYAQFKQERREKIIKMIME